MTTGTAFALGFLGGLLAAWAIALSAKPTNSKGSSRLLKF